MEQHSKQVAQMAAFSAASLQHGMYSEFHCLFVFLTIFHYIHTDGKEFR